MTASAPRMVMVQVSPLTRPPPTAPPSEWWLCDHCDGYGYGKEEEFDNSPLLISSLSFSSVSLVSPLSSPLYFLSAEKVSSLYIMSFPSSRQRKPAEKPLPQPQQREATKVIWRTAKSIRHQTRVARTSAPTLCGATLTLTWEVIDIGLSNRNSVFEELKE